MGMTMTIETVAIAVLVLAGCGSKSQVDTPVTPGVGTEADAGNSTGSGGGASSGQGGGQGLAGNGGACVSKSNCPPAQVDVSATFSPEGALLGFVNQAVDWEFHGVDRNTLAADGQSSTRNVVVLFDKIPVDPSSASNVATITPDPKAGQLANDAKINWTATSQAQGKLDIILRDMDRCMMNETADFCNAYVFRDAYDTRESDVPWQIVTQAGAQTAGASTGTATTASNNNTTTNTTTTNTTAPAKTNVVNVSNPNCGSNTTGNGQIVGGLISGVGGLLSGNILGAAPSLLSSFIGGGGSSQPTQC